ncbi:hypothetical protein SUGI_0287030 [Cryptomeria japonica]|nr:hypothetical protein SUGI_0287030 [Cryptomeria japonica]
MENLKNVQCGLWAEERKEPNNSGHKRIPLLAPSCKATSVLVLREVVADSLQYLPSYAKTGTSTILPPSCRTVLPRKFHCFLSQSPLQVGYLTY